MLFLVASLVLQGHQPGFAEDRELAQLRNDAEQGDAEAQFKLGIVYDFGRGVPEDKLEAVKWYQKAAEQGNAYSQDSLGRMYLTGESIPRNYREAFNWVQRAAEQGYAQAQARIGSIYYFGNGVPEDYVKAYAWWNLAAAQGDEKVVKLKDSLRKSLTRDQLAEAQRLSRQLYERIESSNLE